VIAQTIVTMGAASVSRCSPRGSKTKRSASSLTDHGCHGYQGFLFSRPLPIEPSNSS
jgi:EAL domain-containing protein (putative c-di-GMP-specific phosphodiesterase class I)